MPHPNFNTGFNTGFNTNTNSDPFSRDHHDFAKESTMQDFMNDLKKRDMNGNESKPKKDYSGSTNNNTMGGHHPRKAGIIVNAMAAQNPEEAGIWLREEPEPWHKSESE